MRRVLRHVFTALSALSLLLCVAACVLWVRSYRAADIVMHATVLTDSLQNANYVVSGRGGLGIVRFSPIPRSAPGGWSWRTERGKPILYGNGGWPVDSRANRAGFALFWEPTLTAVLMPIWLVVLVTAVLPACKLLAIRGHASRRRHGLCQACGYDLRASPERCPECGTAAPVSAAAPASAVKGTA